MKPHKHRMHSVAAFAVLLILSQPTALSEEPSEGADEQQVLDTVEVRGVQNDVAMAAFRAGDFETAEVEFLDNAMCALRRERNLAYSVEAAQTNSLRAELLEVSTGVDSNSSQSAATRGRQASFGASGLSTNNSTHPYDVTCDKRGRQLYFAGLSQIQLGKTDKALRNFERATVASKILYDAHYKIGLIKLLAGDTRAAQAQLGKIDGILKRCRNCEAQQEILDRRDHLSRAINGDVSLQ